MYLLILEKASAANERKATPYLEKSLFSQKTPNYSNCCHTIQKPLFFRMQMSFWHRCLVYHPGVTKD